MKKVMVYNIGVGGAKLRLPENSVLLGVLGSGTKIHLVFEVHPEYELTERLFRVFKDGDRIDGRFMFHRGSVVLKQQDAVFIRTVYEQVEIAEEAR